VSLPRWDVPTSWSWVRAGDVASIVGGGTPPSKVEDNFAEEGIPWIGPADLTGFDGAYIGRGRRDLSERGYAASGATLMPAGAVLFSSRAPIGYCAIAANPVSTNQGFKSWVCAEGVAPEYVRYYLLSSVDYADSLASGTTFREISGKRVAEMAFPLAPLAEQRRIVTKLDVLTAGLARAREDASRGLALSKKMRYAVLEQAFRTVQSQVCISSLCSSISDGDHQAPPRSEHGVPFITISAMNDGKVDLSRATRFVPSEYFQNLKRERQPSVGDVLYSVTGSIGIPAAVTAAQEFVFQRHIALLKPNAECDPDWLAYMLAAPQFRSQAEAIATGTAQLTVPLKGLRRLTVPKVGLAVQRECASYIRAAFARTDRLEAEAKKALALIDRLEAAILAKAFRGELVAQDLNDEPASVLLERIRARRAAEPKAKRGRRPKLAS